MTDPPDPGAPGELLLYQTEDGQTRIQCRMEEEILWLSQSQMAELFETSIPNINTHLKNVFAEGELDERATIKDYLIVRSEGNRSVSRQIKHYRLDAVLAVGFRVRSHRGTQFRRWANERLREYLVKGFTMDDERLKNPSGPGAERYLEELLAHIRDIRSSEKVFWRKVLDIYATSVDYDPSVEASQLFFKTVQNKMHWAAHGHTAAEVIAVRADSSQPNMGLTSWSGEKLRKADVVAKNYLNDEELEALNRIVTAYLEFAELQFDAAYSKELGRLSSPKVQSSGGDNFYYTEAARVSKRFATALLVSTYEGNTLFRDAARMLGINKVSTVDEFATALGATSQRNLVRYHRTPQ